MSVRFEDPRRVLKRYGLQPKRSFSQNFLVSSHAIESITKACMLEPGRSVVELGPGCGTLTFALAQTGAKVFAVERDPDMMRVLEAERADADVEIVPGDAKEISLAQFTSEAHPRIVVAGNLPYSITGAILRHLYDERQYVERAVVMVQREVRDRLMAKPDTSEYGALTVFTSQVFDIETVLHIPRTAFHPPPKVSSSVVRLTPRAQPRAAVSGGFDLIVRASFQARRKTLRNALARELGTELAQAVLERAGIDPKRRGETLSVEEFGTLDTALAALRAADA